MLKNNSWLKVVSLVTCNLLLVTCLSGCGYTTRSNISSRYTTIYITPFVNKIDITAESDVASKYKLYRPRLETDITRAVIDKFMWDGNLRPVSYESANVVLNGELMEFRKDPVRYDDSDNVTEYRVNLLVNISLLNNADKSLIWEEKNFTGLTSYFVSGSSAKTEAQAINDAITDLARRIVERCVEEW